jgi:hypothetical protein
MDTQMIVLAIINFLLVIVVALVGYTFREGIKGVRSSLDRLRESIAKLFEYHETHMKEIAATNKRLAALQGEHDAEMRRGGHRPVGHLTRGNPHEHKDK